jgi:hypothetical protein
MSESDSEPPMTHAEYMVAWRAKNRARARAISRAGSAKYREANLEKVRETARVSAAETYARKSNEDRERHLAEIAERNRAYYAKKKTDPDFMTKKMAANARYREAHQERVKETVRTATARWRDRNPDKVLAQSIASRPHRYAATKARRLAKRAAVLAFFGNACCQCGVSDPLLLQIDHVDGGGRHSVTKSVHGLFKMITSDPARAKSEHQLLCANCHVRKTHINGEYVRRRKDP